MEFMFCDKIEGEFNGQPYYKIIVYDFKSQLSRKCSCKKEAYLKFATYKPGDKVDANRIHRFEEQVDKDKFRIKFSIA